MNRIKKISQIWGISLLVNTLSEKICWNALKHVALSGIIWFSWKMSCYTDTILHIHRGRKVTRIRAKQCFLYSQIRCDKIPKMFIVMLYTAYSHMNNICLVWLKNIQLLSFTNYLSFVWALWDKQFFQHIACQTFLTLAFWKIGMTNYIGMKDETI